MTARALVTPWVFALCLAAGCGGARVEPGFESTLRPTGDCPETWLQAADEDERVHLVFRSTDDPVGALRAGASEMTWDFGGDGGAAVLFVEEGRELARGFCDGEGSPVVDRRWHASSGTARLTLEGNALRLVGEALTLSEEAGDGQVSVPTLDLTWTLP